MYQIIISQLKGIFDHKITKVKLMKINCSQKIVIIKAVLQTWNAINTIYKNRDHNLFGAIRCLTITKTNKSNYFTQK